MANQIKYQVGFDVQKQGLNDLKSSLQQLQKMKLSDIMRINNTDLDTARRQFEQISEKARQVEKALEKAFNLKLNTINIQQFKQQLGSLNINDIYSSFQKAGATGQAAFRGLTTQVLGTNMQLKQSHVLLDKMATTLGNTIKWHAASAAINGVSRSVQQAWGYVKHLDGSLNDIRIVTGKSAEQMGRFAEQANNAAKSLGKTTTDYTDAALIYAQQGLSDQEIAKRTEITLKTANVTGQSADAVSEQLTAVWNGYKVNADEAEVYVDRLAAVAATTASDLEELSKGMGKVAAAANQMGVGEDQLAAQLSTIISVTRQAPESVGTALRTVYARISDIKAGIDEDGVTLGKYSGDMAKLGFNVLDATGNLRDMGQVMEQIGYRWGDLTREQQVNLAQTMAGQRQYSNLMALFENFDKYTEALNTAQNAAGTLQQQQSIYMESTAAHLNQLKAAFQDVYDSLVDTDSVNNIIDGFTTVTEKIADFVDGIGGGEQVLRSLGSIAMMVFSQQIAQSLVTTANNFERAKEQAADFEAKLQAAKAWKASGVGNDQTQRYIDNQIKLLERGQRQNINPEVFNEMQNSLKQMADNASALEQIEQKMQHLQQVLSETGITFQDFAEQYETLDQMMSSEDGVQNIISSLKTLDEAYIGLDKEQRALAESLRNLGKETNIENIKNQFNDFIVKVQTGVQNLNGQSLFDTMSEGSQQTFAKIQAQLNSLDIFGTVESQGEQVKHIFVNISKIISDQIAKVRNAQRAAHENHLEELEQERRQVERNQKDAEGTYNKGLKNLDQKFDAQQMVKMAAGVTMLTNGVRQFLNLGSIWKNQDLSIGQKLFQTITNISMSIPMLINGWKGLTAATNLFTVATGQAAVAQLSSAAATIPLIGGLKLVELESGKAAIAVGALGKTLVVSMPLVAGLAAVLGIAAFSIYTEHVKKSTQALIDHNNAVIEAEQKNQQEIESREQLYQSLSDLNEQYKNHEISHTELKEGIQELCKQYDLEKGKVEQLISRYKELDEVIKESRLDDIDEKADSTKEQRKAAEENWAAQAPKTLDITTKDYSEKDDKLLEILREEKMLMQSVDSNGMIQSTIPLGDTIEGYEKLNELIDENSFAINEQGSIYKKINKYLDDNAKLHKEVADIIQKDNEAAQQKRLKDAVGNDFDSIKNIEDFQKKYQELLSTLKDEDKDAAKDYLENLFPQIPQEFYQIGDIINTLKDNIGDVDSKTEKFLSKLSNEDLIALKNRILIDPEGIQSWEDVVKMAKELTEFDFSNINTLKGQQDFDDAISQAEGRYDNYQQAQDKLRDNKNLSKSEMKQLDLPQQMIDQYFQKMLNGQYKLKENAEQFFDAIDDLKVKDFINILGEVNNQIEKIDNLRKLQQDYKDAGAADFNYGANDSVADMQVNTLPTQNGLEQVGKLTEFGQQMVQNQINYLMAISDSDDELRKLAEDAQSMLDSGETNVGLVRELADAYHQAGDQFEGMDERQQSLLEKSGQLQETLQAAFEPLDEDIDEQALNNLADHLQKIADKSEDIPDYLEGDRQAAQEFAESILRFNDAVDDVSKNFDDWMANLQAYKDGDQTGFITESIQGLKDAYGDLLNIDGSILPDSFLSDINNLNLMKQAIEGSTQAYQKLADAASQQILVDIATDNPKVKLEDLQSQYDIFKSQIENHPAEVYVENSKAVQALQQIADAAVASSGDVDKAMAQVQAAIQSQNYTAEMEVKTAESTDVDQNDDMTKTLQAHPFTERMPKLIPGKKVGDKQSAIYSGTTQAEGVVYGINTSITPNDSETKKQQTATGLKIKKIGKTADGGVKVKNSKHKTSGGGAKKRSGGGGGNKGGGSGSKSTPAYKVKKAPGNNLTQATKLTKTQLLDPYFEINKQLERNQKLLKDVSRESDKAFGKERIKLLKQNAKLLRQQNQTFLARKETINNQEKIDKRPQLKKYGFTFDKDTDDITNYQDIVGKAQEESDDATNAYNNYVSTYNSLAKSANQARTKYDDIQKLYKEYTDKNTSKKRKQKVAKKLRKLLGLKSNQKITKERKNNVQKKLKAIIDKGTKAQTKLNNLKKEADETKEDLTNKSKAATDWQEIVKIGDEIQQQKEENLFNSYKDDVEAFNYQIQLKLDMGQAERDWNDFKREVLNKDNIFKDNNFSTILKNMQNDWSNFITYFQKENGNQGDLLDTIEHLQKLKTIIEEVKTARQQGIDSTTDYGDLMNQSIEDFNTYFKSLEEQYTGVKESIDNIRQGLVETMDDIENSFDEQIDKYESVSDLLEYNLDLLDLLYGQKNYQAMDSYYTQLRNNQLEEIDLLRRESEFWYQQWQDAADKGQTELAKNFEKKYKDTISNLNSTLSDSIKTLQDKYINSINQIFNNLDNHITKGQGIDYIELDWELQNKNNEGYLDTIDAAFAIDNLENKFQDLLKNTKGIKNQQAIKKIMDEQLQNLKEKEKVTEYDIERAEQLLQIEQARAALEDAQAAKTELRLRRDSQGNYYYEYTASMQATTEAEQKLLEAQNDLYKMDKQQYQNNLNDMLNIWKEFQSKYIDILNDTNLTEEEKRKRQQLLEKEYGEYINNLTAKNFDIRNNLSESALASFAEIYNTSLKDLGKLSDDQKQNLMADLITGWDGGIQTMINQITGEDGFSELIKNTLGEIEEKTKEYQESIEDMSTVAGKNLNNLKTGIDDVTDAYKTLIENNDDFIKEMNNRTTLIKDLVDALEKYELKLKTIEDMITADKKFIQETYENSIDLENNSSLKVDFSDLKTILEDTFDSNNFSQIIKEALKNIQLIDSNVIDQILSKYFPSLITPTPETFASGGYTGEWENNKGKLALLHQKELVLNEPDTKNLLNTISILKTIDTSLNTNLISKIQDINYQLIKENSNSAAVEQQVYIEASFPNVNSKRQIEEAFNDLVNLAAQRAMRK